MRKLSLITLLLAVAAVAVADGNKATGSLVIDPATFTPGALTVGTDNLLNITALGHGTWRFAGSNHPTPSAAQFRVTGQEGYEFLFVATDFTVLHPSGKSMWISPLVAMVDKVTHGTVPATVKVGGTLGLVGDPTPGVWTGTFSVTAVYL